MKINGGKPLQAPLAQTQEQRKTDGRKKTEKQLSTPLDELKLSQQAVSFLRQQQAKQKEQRSVVDILLGSKQEENDPYAYEREMAEIRENCAKIAARIRKGDKVPLKDMRYLMKHDARLYVLTMAMRQEKEDPKKWKSVLKNEEQEGQAQQVELSVSVTQEPAVSGESASTGTTSGEMGSGTTTG